MTKTELVQLLSKFLLQGKKILKKDFCSVHEVAIRTFERAIKDIRADGFELTRGFVDSEHGRTAAFSLSSKERAKMFHNKESAQSLVNDLVMGVLIPSGDPGKKKDGKNTNASVFIPGMKARVCPEIFTKVNSALHLRKALQISYKERRLTVHTLALYFRAGYWYMRMIEPNSTTIKTLRLDRIETCKFTGQKFGEISSYSLEKEQSRSYGRLLGMEPENASFWCEKSLADYLKKHPLHESQIIKNETEESAVVELLYNSKTDLLRRVKVFLPSLIPVSPPSLVKKFKSELKTALGRIPGTLQ